MPELSDVAVAFGLLNNRGLNGRRITIEIEPSMKTGKRATEPWRQVARTERHFMKLDNG